MKKFVKELVTNRFGILMATLNICYFFFSKNYFQNCGENLSLCDRNDFYWINFYFTKLMVSINEVVLDTTMTIYRFVPKYDGVPESIYFPIQFFTFFFLIIFQWLFIGWIAKNIAQGIRSK